MTDLTDATNRIETLMHQLNDAQRDTVRLELRQEDHNRNIHLLVRLWNAMVRTEQGWTITINRGLDDDLLREFEQAVLNE